MSRGLGDVYKRQDQNIVVDIFILIAVPSAQDCIRMQHTIISCKEVILALTYTECRNQMRQNLGSVNPSPHKRVIWHLIELIPRKFCCHEIFDTALLHNLRKCP